MRPDRPPGLPYILCIGCFLALPPAQATPSDLTTVQPVEGTNLILHNPDMGWVLYENYPLDQEPHGSSTMLTLPNESFPEVDAVAIMFSWRDVETSEGVHDFSKVDKAYDYWATRRKEIQLRMSSEPLMVGTGAGPPLYVLNRLSEKEKQTRRMDHSEYVVADSMNTFYRERLAAFLRAVNRHFDHARPVTLIDLRGFGAWGEWHSGFRYPDLKTRRRALKGIIGLWNKALPDHLLALSYSYDPDGPKEFYAGPNNKLETRFTTNYTDFLRFSAFDYAVTRKNITFRRDGCGGAVHSNERRFNEEAFSHYHRGPLFGEFLGGYGAVKQGGSNWVTWMVEDALSLHPNYLNLIGWQSEDALAFIRERPDLVTKGALQMGYRFVPTQIEYPSVIERNVSFHIRSRWLNRGVGRALRNYQLTFLLVKFQASEGRAPRVPDIVDSHSFTVVAAKACELPTASWVKGQTYAVSQQVSFPVAASGRYQLAFSLRDPETGHPIALPLREKTAYGAYIVGPIEVKSPRH